MSKKIAFFQQDINDTVKSIGDIAFPDVPCGQMPGYDSRFTIEADQNYVNDLCIQVDENAVLNDYIAQFRSVATNTVYSSTPVEFAGTRPPHR